MTRIILLWLLLANTVFGQEITGPTEAAIYQDVWLELSGGAGTFVAIETPVYKVISDPKRTAPNAAMFMAFAPGTYTVIAGFNGEPGPSYTFFEIVVATEQPPPPVDDSITAENVRKWIALVPRSARDDPLKNGLTGETMTRQQATGVTFSNIGKAGPALGAVAALDQMLSTALVSTWGTTASQWQPFADKIDAALGALQATGVSVADYSQAFRTIGEGLE